MELCFHIFSLLPVKTLLLLRAVCKCFLSVIDDSEFVSFHLHHFPSNVLGTTFLTVRGYVHHSNKTLLYGASLISTSNNQGFTDHIYSPDDMQVKGSLNGIVLLVSSSEDRVLLWNPSLRKHRWLSPPTTIFNYSALGYHTACNEHMVLALCWDGAWVYSVKTSSWTAVAFDRRNLGSTFLSYDEYVSVNDGMLLLEMIFLDHVNYMYTWFEFQTRVFRYAYDPVDIKPTHCGLMKLDGGSTVGMWGYDVEDQPSIWALQTDTMSWSKRYKISRELMRHKACTFSLVERNKELLWTYFNRGEIEVFTSDIETQVIKNHVKYPTPISCHGTYIESLFMLH